ncbi:Conserved_hypothetical protein [Hexamita inflata]|uniref:Uncharacterized protein n=1 Tax=Hexamita inflata TaxID=28002 RepID=A0AA86UR65_9EUKA|nr:Conserved hypothetical protein [Hexamita inflata]CAI9961557.1 Conserved hypothetical protein [Hexamita inflata]
MMHIGNGSQSLQNGGKQKESLLYQKRMRTPAAPLDSLKSSTTSMEVQIKQMPQTFSQDSHQFQHFSASLEQLQMRLQQRAQQRDDSTQLAVRAADGDAMTAIEAAKFFRDLAVIQQNQSVALLTQVDGVRRQHDSEKRRAMRMEQQLEYFDVEFEQEKEALIASVNKIKQTVQECQLLATELGFPIPQQPEILETITPQCFESEHDGYITVDGQEKSLKSVSLSLLIGEQQVLRNHNFLMKQMISDIQKQKAQKATENQQSETVSQQILQSQYSNPVEIFQKEFQGSGIAVARELMLLRNKAAGYLLREQEFDCDQLLRRESMDDNSLRAIIVGLQNELSYAKQQLSQLQNIGIGQQLGTRQKEFVFTPLQIKKLAEMALSNSDRDLLPDTLARSVDVLVAESLKASEQAANAAIEAKQARIPVSQLQMLIEKRNQTLQGLDKVSLDLMQFLRENQSQPDLESQVVKFLMDRNIQLPDDFNPQHENEEPKNSLQYAARAQEIALDRNREFQLILDQFNDYLREVLKSLEKENVEKFQKDGTGYTEVLEKLSHLLEHSRSLHLQVANRDFVIVKLQAIIEQIVNEKAKGKNDIIHLIGVRNGMVAAYMQLRRKYELLQIQTQTLKTSAQNPIQIAIDTAAESYNQKLANSLAAESTDYTRAVAGLSEVVRNEVHHFEEELEKGIKQVNSVVKNYINIVNNRAQVAVQTDRQRKCYDQSIQVQIVAEVDPKQKKK